MTDQRYDTISCRGFQYECELGFHDCEQGIRQKIKLDFDAFVEPLKKEERDRVECIRFDYFEAHRLIREWLGYKKFNLLESLAEELAGILLERFRIAAIRVSVTKFPVDIPGSEAVTYTCYRSLLE